MLYFISPCSAPLKHISSGQLVNEGGFLHPHRRLDTFVLLVGCQGTLYIEQEGVPYEVGPDQFLLLFPMREHLGFRASTGLLSYYWCHFQAAAGYELAGEQEVGRYLFLMGSDQDHMLNDRYIVPEYGRIRSGDKTSMVFRQLLDLAERKKRYSEYVTHYALSLLALEITSEFIDSYKVNEDRANSLIAAVMEWLRTHYSDENLNVSAVAETFGYNPNYLSSAFKRQTGLSLLRYINKLRISAAKQLLLNSGDPIRIIASRVGIHDEKHFMKLFKQMEQITPSKYRNAFYRRHINRQ